MSGRIKHMERSHRSYKASRNTLGVINHKAQLVQNAAAIRKQNESILAKLFSKFARLKKGDR